MRLTLEFEYASSPHRSDDGGVGFFRKTVDRDLARVPSTGEFIRLDAPGGPLAKIQTVIWESDGSVTLELAKLHGTQSVDRNALRDEGWIEPPEWWLG